MLLAFYLKTNHSVMLLDQIAYTHFLSSLVTLFQHDVDECAHAELNECHQICVNTPGSYACRCHEGYLLMEDGITCHCEHKQDYYINSIIIQLDRNFEYILDMHNAMLHNS